MSMAKQFLIIIFFVFLLSPLTQRPAYLYSIIIPLRTLLVTECLAMKCTAIKLTAKNEHINETKLTTAKPTNWPRTVFVTEESHRYSFPYMVRKLKRPSTPILAVKKLNLPENLQSFNTGSSLEKWTKKHPRLKSSFKPQLSREDEDFCYDTLENSSFFNGTEDDDEEDEDNYSLANLEYDVHSDIEELLKKSQVEGDQPLPSPRQNRKIKKKKKPKKTIISKPPTPQTEQIIRVDVVSMTVDDDCKPSRVIDDKGDFLNNEETDDVGEGDEDIIIRCSQLALKQRRR